MNLGAPQRPRLLGVDAAASPGAMFEWRSDGGKPGAIDAAVGTPVPTSGTEGAMMQYAIVRCAR